MRVLHVLASMDPAQGGPPAVACRLAAAEAMNGHDTTVVSHEAPGRSDSVAASLDGIPSIARVRFVGLPPGLKWRTFLPTEARQRLAELIANHDVAHLHGIWEPIVRRAAALSEAARKPYVVTPHGMLDPWSLGQHWLKKRLALMLSYRHMLQHATCLHLLNNDEAELIKPLGLRCPMRVIPNGVFLEEIEPLPRPGAFRAEHPELRSDPYVLFLSRLHFKKGLDYLADAFAAVARRHPSLRMVVAGPDGGAQADFEVRVRRHGLRDRVHLVGPLYSTEKFGAMVDAACFCLPSRQEGFSMAVTEAMACGCPVVVSEACHFPEVATVGAGEVVPLEGPRIADALDRVVSDPSRGKSMGNAGRKLVIDRYLWPRIAQQAVDAYRRQRD